MKANILVPLAVALLAGPSAASATTASLLNNGSFETTFSYGQAISAANVGIWAIGDPAASVTANATLGITPYDGLRMLQFTMAGDQNNYSDDVYQIIDLRAYATAIDAGQAQIDASAYFNTAGVANGGITLFTFAALPANFQDPVFLATPFARRYISLDTNTSTWQLDEILNKTLPTGTRYVFYGLNHTAASSIDGTRYATAFADSAGFALTVPDTGSTVPEPGTFALLGFGLAGLGLSRRRRAV